MALGNTIGRMVGQPPASKNPPELANPIVQLFQGLQQLQSMWQQLSGLIQQLSGGGAGGGGSGAGGGDGESLAQAPGGAALTDARVLAGIAARGAGPTPGDVRFSTAIPTDLSALRDQLTELGRSLRPRADAMEGPASLTQAATLNATSAILDQALLAGSHGPSVHRLDLSRLQEEATRIAATLPSPALATQALGAAETMARMRGAGGPVLQMLQQVLGVFQQALSLLQKIKPATDGAKVRAE